MKYLRFQLQVFIGPTGGYAVHALTPRGEGQASFNLRSLPDEACDWGFFGWARQSMPSFGDRKPSPEDVGELLFGAVFQGEVLRLYERSLDLLAAEPELGLRIEVTFDPREHRLAKLQLLPWELLRQPGTSEFLALSRRLPVTRFLAVPRPVYASAKPHILRILAVAANPFHPDLPSLDLAGELKNLRDAVGAMAEVKTPSAPTLAALRQELRIEEFHVLHFMGHCGSAIGQEQKVLFFESKEGTADPVRASDLVNKLSDHPTLRLVVLNSCGSARVTKGAPDGKDCDASKGVASSLVLGGMPAVIAMQAPISDEAAIAFSKAIYQQLAAGDPVDTAITEGRQAVHSVNPMGCEWATPVLFLRSPSGELYPDRDLRDPYASNTRVRRLAAVLVVLLLAASLATIVRQYWIARLVSEGVSFFEHEEWQLARERFSAALSLGRNTEVLADLAATEEKLGDLRAAEQHYREAVRRQPESEEHLFNLGHFLNGKQRYDEAYRLLQKAVVLDPAHVDAYGELAQAAAGRGMFGRARLNLRVALQLDPERPALYRRLGQLELEAGNPLMALPYLEEARRRYPLGELGRAESVGLLAQVHGRLGEPALACREIEEFKLLDPPGITPWAPGLQALESRLGCRAIR